METGNQIELNNKVEKFIALLLFACADRLCRSDTFCGIRTKSENLTEEEIDHVRVLAHSSRETSAHRKTWSGNKCSFLMCLHIISYTSFRIQMSPGKMLHKRNFMRTDTF